LSIRALQSVLTHANLPTTSSYLHADEADLEAAAVMPTVLGPPHQRSAEAKPHA